ncbi:hypothetical protein PHISP_01418 [Aspergillus sp. HF37]|nr:hypothetical protein PHISP_01418 [Aspergillus sp. HF37]
MGLLEKLQSSTHLRLAVSYTHTINPLIKPPEIELYRLEQRYARRKHRSSFHAGAQYVDGEYIYTNGPTPPTGPVAKHSTGGASWRPPAWGSSQDSRWR